MTVEVWQAALLRKKAKELGVSEAHLLRVALPCIAELRSVDGIDERLWEELSEVFEGLRARRSNEIARGWSREDLYEDRLARWPRRPWIERILEGSE